MSPMTAGKGPDKSPSGDPVELSLINIDYFFLEGHRSGNAMQ